MKTITKYYKAHLYQYQRHFLTIGMVVFLVILFQLIAAPIKKYHNWKGEVSTYKGDSSTDSLQKILAYKQALLLASKSDSIYVAISLPDSLIGLYLKGVNIFSSKISKYEESIFLTDINAQVYYEQFGDSTKAVLLKSTIIREPIKIKMAPKNAMEAAAMATIPDSLTFDPAFISYQLENGTVVNLVAEEEYYLSVRMRFFNAAKEFSNILDGLVHFKIKKYNPKVCVRIDNVDLSSIYRALPKEPIVIVRI